MQARKNQKLRPEDMIMWDSAECSEFLGYNRHYFVTRISKKPGFPRARRDGKRWYKHEIIDWRNGD